MVVAEVIVQFDQKLLGLYFTSVVQKSTWIIAITGVARVNEALNAGERIRVAQIVLEHKWLGRFFALNRDWFGVAGGVVIMLFGAHFVGVFRIGFLDRDMRFEAKTEGGSAFGAYLLGLAFAFGWTPCLGPILGSILTIAAAEASATRGSALLLAYSLGLGLPFIVVAAFFPLLTGLMRFLKRHMQRIERIMGLLLWTIGLMLVTGQFSDMSRWILETFPWAQSLG